VIGLLRRILQALRGGGLQPRGRELQPGERLDAAHEKLKQTIPPRQD
jgi:hypothetical protein